MTAPSTLQHSPTCGGKRVEQSSHQNREERIEVTTWRCLDCAAFASQGRPLTEAELSESDR